MLGINCDMIQTLPGPRDQLGSLERTRRSRRETPRFVLPSLLAPNTRTLLIVMLLAVLSAAPSMQLALWPTEGTFGPLSNLSSFGIGASPGSLSPGPNGLEKCKNVRWDADFSHNPHPGMPPRYVPVCADLTPRELRRLENARRFEERQTATPFSIRFTCTDSTQIVCEKAKLGFEKAGRRLAQVLKIDTTVVVQATFRSFCEGQGQACGLRNTLGQAQASSYLQGKFGDDGPWLFPQSLFKQINNGAQVSMREVDIIAEFNTDFKFWFEGDGPIARDQVDFELVVTHEFTHGLGMTSSWNTWFKDVYPVLSTQDFLTPSIFIQSPVGDPSLNNLFFAGWQQLQILDKYLYAVDTGKSFVDSAKTITSFTGTSRTPLNTWITQFQASGEPYREAQNLYSICTGGYRKLEFRIPPNAASKGSTNVFMQTLPGRWLPGSSIAHVDLQSYTAGPDFMMIPDVTSLIGRSLDNIIATQSVGWRYGAIGPQMAGMLSAMGWPTLISAADSNVTTNGTAGGVVTPVTPTNQPITPTQQQPQMIGPFTIPQFIGIVVGGVAVAAAIAAAIVYGVKRSKKGKAPPSSSANGSSGGSGGYPMDSEYALSPYPAPPAAAYTQASRNAVAPAYTIYQTEVQPNGVTYAYPVAATTYVASSMPPPMPLSAYGTPIRAAPSPPMSNSYIDDPYLASMPTNAAERNARGVYAEAAGTSPQSQSDEDYARTLQQQEEILAGVALSSVAPAAPASRYVRPAPAPPSLPPRRATAVAGESDYELAKRLQEEEEKASGLSAAPATPPRRAPAPPPTGPRPMPSSTSSYSSPSANDSTIEEMNIGGIQARIRALNASATSPGSRPPGSYLNE